MGDEGSRTIKQITQIMAFNFLEIKKLGAMYRAIESALTRCLLFGNTSDCIILVNFGVPPHQFHLQGLG